MKRLIVSLVALCLLALTVGCGGVSSTGTLAYVANSTGTGFTVYNVNTDGTLTTASISPQGAVAPPMTMVFAPNGKWAYFLDRGTCPVSGGECLSSAIYAYTRAGDGSLNTYIDKYPVNASSLVVSPNSQFLYAAAPLVQQGYLYTYFIDQNTGILSGTNQSVNYPIDQLIMAPGGSIMYGLSKSKKSVVSFSLNSTNGTAAESATKPVGSSPTQMILAVNGSYLYVLDSKDMLQMNASVTPGSCVAPNDVTCTPVFYAFNTASGGTLNPMAGSPFHMNANRLTNAYPRNPIAGITSNDSRYLFIANQGTEDISVFRISGTTAPGGEPVEVTTSETITVNGVSASTSSPFPCGNVTGSSEPCVPVYVSISNANNGLYVVDSQDSKVWQFRIDQATGVLRAQSPAFVAGESASSAPTWITIH